MDLKGSSGARDTIEVKLPIYARDMSVLGKTMGTRMDRMVHTCFLSEAFATWVLNRYENSIYDEFLTHIVFLDPEHPERGVTVSQTDVHNEFPTVLMPIRERQITREIVEKREIVRHLRELLRETREEIRLVGGDYRRSEGAGSSGYIRERGQEASGSSDHVYERGQVVDGSSDYTHERGQISSGSSDYTYERGQRVAGSSDYINEIGQMAADSSDHTYENGRMTAGRSSERNRSSEISDVFFEGQLISPAEIIERENRLVQLLEEQTEQLKEYEDTERYYFYSEGNPFINEKSQILEIERERLEFLREQVIRREKELTGGNMESDRASAEQRGYDGNTDGSDEDKYVGAEDGRPAVSYGSSEVVRHAGSDRKRLTSYIDVGSGAGGSAEIDRESGDSLASDGEWGRDLSGGRVSFYEIMRHLVLYRDSFADEDESDTGIALSGLVRILDERQKTLDRLERVWSVRKTDHPDQSDVYSGESRDRADQTGQVGLISGSAGRDDRSVRHDLDIRWRLSEGIRTEQKEIRSFLEYLRIPSSESDTSGGSDLSDGEVRDISDNYDLLYDNQISSSFVFSYIDRGREELWDRLESERRLAIREEAREYYEKMTATGMIRELSTGELFGGTDLVYGRSKISESREGVFFDEGLQIETLHQVLDNRISQLDRLERVIRQIDGTSEDFGDQAEFQSGGIRGVARTVYRYNLTGASPELTLREGYPWTGSADQGNSFGDNSIQNAGLTYVQNKTDSTPDGEKVEQLTTTVKDIMEYLEDERDRADDESRKIDRLKETVREQQEMIESMVSERERSARDEEESKIDMERAEKVRDIFDYDSRLEQMRRGIR